MKRTITKREEQALRLCHHDFDGLTIEVAADIMGVFPDSVRRLLCEAEHKAPQMFPILTPEHRAIIAMYDKDDSCDTIAKALKISERALTRRVAFLRQHGFLKNRGTVQFQEWMSGYIRERF